MNPRALFRNALASCLLLLCLASGAHVRAQDGDELDEGEGEDRATFNLQIDEKGAARLWLGLPVKPEDPEALRQVLGEAVDLPLSFEKDTEVEYQDEESEDEEEEAGWWSARAHSDRAFPRRGLVSAGRLDVSRLAGALRPLGVKLLYVTVTFNGQRKNLRLSGAEKLVVPEESASRAGLALNYYSANFKTDEAAATPPIEFSWGYRPADILRQLVPLFLFIVVPLLLTLRTRWAIARAKGADATEVWGRYFRFLSRLIYFSWLAWLPLCSMAELGDLLSALGEDGGGLFFFQALGLAFYFAPPLLVLWLCHRLSSDIYRRVGGVGWSPRAVVGRVIALNAVQVAPFFLVVLGLGSLGPKGHYAGLLLLAGVVAWILLGQLAGRAYSAAAHPLTRGELRDRVFALAEKAGVSLRQIYVLPDGPAQLSNAFARGDNSVMLTASLLRHLTKREVNALLAHEIGHLKEKHPQATARLTVGSIVAANLVAMSLASAAGMQRWVPALVSLSLGAALLVTHYLSRGNERHADSIGLNLTRDPEAFITGLARLSRLNLMPLEGVGRGGVLNTHPATLERLRDLAGFGGVTPARFEELLAEVGAGDAEGERYAAPEATQDRVLSSAFKSRHAARLMWSIIALIVVLPTLFALLLERLWPQYWLILALMPAGPLLTFALYQLFRNFVAFTGYAKMTARLRERLAPPAESVCVGLAPAAEPRSYENFPYWDAGLLHFSGGRLCYAGELARFELPRAQVKEIYLEDAQPVWLRQKHLYVRWHDDAQGRGGTFYLLPLEERTLLRSRRRTALLCGRLRDWHAGEAGDADARPTEAPAAAPDFDAVTGQLMSERLNGRAFRRSLFLLLWLSFLLSIGVRLSLAGILYSLVVVASVCALDQVPKLLDRLARRSGPVRKADESPGDVRPYRRDSWAES